MKQTTAVEWLEQNMPNISKHIPLGIALEFAARIQEAKKKEKKLLHECASFWSGKENGVEKPIFEQYYTEKFSK